jgi:hypothetical protein
MNFEELVPILDKCNYITFPSVKNNVTTFRWVKLHYKEPPKVSPLLFFLSFYQNECLNEDSDI